MQKFVIRGREQSATNVGRARFACTSTAKAAPSTHLLGRVVPHGGPFSRCTVVQLADHIGVGWRHGSNSWPCVESRFLALFLRRAREEPAPGRHTSGCYAAAHLILEKPASQTLRAGRLHHQEVRRSVGPNKGIEQRAQIRGAWR